MVEQKTIGKRWRIEIAIISTIRDFNSACELRDRLEKILRTSQGVEEGLSSEIEWFKGD